MKLLALALVAAAGVASSQQHDLATEPAVMGVPQGASVTCTAPGGCVMFNQAAVRAVDQALKACRSKGGSDV